MISTSTNLVDNLAPLGRFQHAVLARTDHVLVWVSLYSVLVRLAQLPLSHSKYFLTVVCEILVWLEKKIRYQSRKMEIFLDRIFLRTCCIFLRICFHWEPVDFIILVKFETLVYFKKYQQNCPSLLYFSFLFNNSYRPGLPEVSTPLNYHGTRSEGVEHHDKMCELEGRLQIQLQSNFVLAWKVLCQSNRLIWILNDHNNIKQHWIATWGLRPYTIRIC